MIDFASAQNVASHARGLTSVSLTLEFVVVWVVNDGFNAICDPIKCAVVTGSTEHLVTSADLENASTAFGTSARFGVDEFCRGEIVGMACMFGILLVAFDFVAVLTGPHITKVTLPLGAEKSAAICFRVGARSYKCGALGRGITTSHYFSVGGGTYANSIFDALFFGSKRASPSFKFGDFSSEFCLFVAKSVFAPHKFGDALTRGEKCLFFLEHNRLAMFFPVLCHEFLSKVFHQEFAWKFFVTFHTVGYLICGVKYDSGVALATGFESAPMTLDRNMGGLIVFLTTNDAFGFRGGWND